MTAAKGAVWQPSPPFGRRIVNAIKRRRKTLGAIALAAAGLAVVWAEYTLSINRMTARIEGQSDLVSTRSGILEFAESGVGQPVLMIHGSGGGFDQGLEFAWPLIESGFHVVAPSRFGYLRSDYPADSSPAAQADAFADLLDHLKISRVAVIGGSAGAPSAIQFALKYPERCSALVLLVPLAYVPSREEDADGASNGTIFMAALHSDFLYWLGISFVPDAMVKSILATDPLLLQTASAEERERVQRTLATVLPVSRRAKGIESDTNLARSLGPLPLQNIHVPTLAISVKDDRYNTLPAAEYITTQVPNARLITYATGGHLWVGHNQELFDSVSQFLRQNSERPSLDQ